MFKVYDILHLIFLLWLIGQFYCEAKDEKVYNMCGNGVVSPELDDTGLVRVISNRIHFGAQCNLVFQLCKSCRLWLRLTNSNIINNQRCYPIVSSHCLTDCTYLRVIDETYNRSHAFFFQKDDEFRSISNHVNITLCNNLNLNLQFQVEFKVERKKKFINLTTLGSYETSTTFESPGFPSSYEVNGEQFLYEIVKPDFVQEMLVTFTDWILSPESKLVVYTFTTPMIFLGNSSRPVFASSESFQLVFSTGTKSNVYKPVIVRGFKAVIKIKRNPQPPNLIPIPKTMCGRNVIRKDYGGLIDFRPYTTSIYDCVWVILIHPRYNMVAIQLQDFTARSMTRIEFREGLTSNGSLIKTLYPSQSFIFRNPNGFYIRLRGEMGSGDHFSLSYASTSSSVNSCAYLFKCRSGFCIHSTLECDGINHCLDDSDETNCFKPDDRVTKSNPSNWSVSIIIPVVITIFILIILCLFFIFVRRFRKISRGSAVQRQRRSASFRGNFSQQYLHNHFSMNLTLEGELDAPPPYEEVINTPSPRGNWNLAFNWSQQDLRDTSVPPPPYSEYMRENEANIYTILTDPDTSDHSVLPPTDTGTLNNHTDPTTEEQPPVSETGSNTENIYATICETTTANSLDRWMVDRSTSTLEQGIDADYSKIAAGGQVGHEGSVEASPLGKNCSGEAQQANQNNERYIPSADASDLSAAVVGFENLKSNDSRQQSVSVERPFVQGTRSRSVDLIPECELNSSSDILHDGQNDAQNSENKNGSITRSNSYPSIAVATNGQLNSEVFV